MIDIIEIAETLIRGDRCLTFPLQVNNGWVSDQAGHHVLDIRGWGFIQYLDNGGERSAELQDKIGEWVVETLNAEYERIQALRRSTHV